jgi:hypothetical protein
MLTIRPTRCARSFFGSMACSSVSIRFQSIYAIAAAEPAVLRSNEILTMHLGPEDGWWP